MSSYMYIFVNVLFLSLLYNIYLHNKEENMKNGIDYEEVEIALKKVGRTMPELYNFVGYSRQSSNNFKAQGYIPIKYAAKIAAFLNVGLDDVITSNISKSLNKKISKKDKTNEPDAIILPMLPAGAGAEALGDSNLIEHISIERKMLSRDTLSNIDENTSMIKVVGNSMQPLINENDIIFIDMANGRRFVLADGIYLVRYGDTIQIKQVQFLGNGSINLISINKDYPDYNPAKDGIEWEILGKPFMKWGVENFSKLVLA